MRALVLFATLLAGSALAPAADAPTGIDEAVKILEKHLAEAKDAETREKLREAVAALKKIAAAPVVQDHLISDFVDDRGKYVGKTLSFRLTYKGGGLVPLDQRAGGKAPFTGEDPKNGAKLVITVEIPGDLKLPAAKDGEEVVVTFKVGAKKGTDVAVRIARP